MTVEPLAVEWVIGIAAVAALLGIGIGYLIAGRGARRTHVSQLEESLESAREELSDYKGQVFGQFAETADKFRALDKSYNDLHRHLAESSLALCGDSATPLLEAPGESNQDAPSQEISDEAADEEIVVSEAPDEMVQEVDANVAETLDETADEIADSVEQTVDAVDAESLQQSDVADEVPTLNPVDSDTTSTESAKDSNEPPRQSA